MSRSRRKKPFTGMTTAPSDKPFKADEHRAERRSVRQIITSGADGDDRRLQKVRGNPWKAPKDGKRRIDPKSKGMRK